jgi:hypothetical protein
MGEIGQESILRLCLDATVALNAGKKSELPPRLQLISYRFDLLFCFDGVEPRGY